jgi:hypothetical protein
MVVPKHLSDFPLGAGLCCNKETALLADVGSLKCFL